MEAIKAEEDFRMKAEEAAAKAEGQATAAAQANMTDEERLLAKINEQQGEHARNVVFAILGASVFSALFKWIFSYLW